ncbi:hypothetical protein BGZ99_002676 [Dissophora globulifera]|uniref:Uncharacterized protein n=1 Tax=Dissophora globulifera TaxID=979702 RepID=A0A9P6UX51_9FUNG|nr:hypothetical protein BGZ99_002676 [Dissophora globulifera]
MEWFRSSRPAKDALELANVNLKIARSTQDRKQALKYCKIAKKELERIDVSGSSMHLDQIIAAYREHGGIMDKLGFNDKAIKSYRMADKLEQYLPRTPVPQRVTVIAQPLPLSPTKDSPIRNSASTSPATPVGDRLLSSLKIVDAPDYVSSSAPTGVSVVSQPMPIPGHNLELVPATIFAKDFHPRLYEGALPRPDEDLTETRQLAYCLALLQASPSSTDSLKEPARTWLHNTKANQDEQERLKAMATDLLLEFMRDTLKDEKTTAEITCIAPVLESNNFRSLLGALVTNIRDSPLLHVHALEGLDRVIECATPGSMDPDDLIRILEYLKLCLEGTHQQSLDHIYRLTRTVSYILDAMVDSEIKDLDRVKLHTPLMLYAKELKKNTDPYMVFQAAYAFQALLRVPDDEERWQTVLRHTGTVLKGAGRLFSAAKGFNVGDFIDAIQGGLEGASQLFQAVGDAYDDFSALKDSGQDLMEALITSFSQQRDWYPMLRGIDTLLQDGELTKVKAMVCNAPCRRELAFQWGLCQRLGSLAADSTWDIDSQEGAVAFLGEIYQNDAVWGQEVKVKQCVLDILMQLASLSGGAKQAAEHLLLAFRDDNDAGKRALCEASQKEGPSSHLWKVALPPLSSSPLLDRVQKTPAVEADLRRLARNRLEELGDAIYIAPEAKSHRQAGDNDLFDLTTKTREFLDSNRKVLLLWGDSGAGKSTFNKELERELWNDYMNCEDRILRKTKKIPIFVSLPAVDKSETDLIGRQLREDYFEEAQIKELKANREFVLICDGYDECQQMRNLYNINKLNRPGQWNAHMVISCRSEYLGNDYRYLFQPEDRQGQTGKTLMQEAVIAPFSTERIQAYIEKYVITEAPNWEVSDYLQVFDRIPSLRELVTNPFLLTLSLRVLPDMTDLRENMSFMKITRVMLYDRFLDHWVDQGKERLIKRELVGDDKEAFEALCDDSFSQSAILFVKELAVAIFKNQDGTPVVEYSHNREKDSWKTKFFGRDNEKKLLREACPLRRDGNQFRFIHQSILEYGLARAVFEPQLGEEYGTNEQETIAAAGERSEYQGTENDMSVATASALDVDSPLLWKSFVNKPAVLHFLAERATQEPVFKRQLHDFIECSKTDKKWSIAAANSITILIRAGVRFNEADLKGIQISGADLSGGQFDSAELQGADLRNVNFRDIWLRQANLSNALMSGAQFGELPYLEQDSMVRSCEYSPDGANYIAGLDSGAICVYDTATWVKTHTLQGHTKRIRSVIYSPSGHQIASSSDDKTVRLWDAQTGSLEHKLIGHTSSISSLTYSPDGHQIASGSRDNIVRLWDPQTGSSGPILSGHTNKITSVRYSPSGHQIASASRDRTVRLWDTQSGSPGLILSGHTGIVNSVIYSPSGHQIASASSDLTVRLWDAQTGSLTSILNGHTDNVTSVIYSPNGLQIASGSSDDTVRLWDVQTASPGPVLTGHTHWISAVTFSPNSHQIASGSFDKTVRLWDAQTGSPGPTLSGHTSRISSVTFSPNGNQIASGSRDRTVRLWNAQIGSPTHSLSQHTGSINNVIYSPDGRQIASGSRDFTVRLWDAQTGAPGPTLSGHTDGVRCTAYSPSGRQIASGSFDKTVRLWDVQTGSLDRILSGHTHVVGNVTYSPSGQQIATGSYDKTVRLWDAQSGAPGPILSGHTDIITRVVYSPSGHQLASGGGDGTVRLWDAQTGTPGHILTGHTENVTCVAYSPSGHQIASGGYDQIVRLWDTQTGSPGPILSGHTRNIARLLYSPSGHQIASGSVDNTVRLWDTETGAPGHTLSGHTGRITGLTYSSSGRQVASGAYDKTIRLWDVDSGQCLLVVDDAHGVTGRLAWKVTLRGIFFAICCDNSVRSWKLIESEDHYRAHLRWRSVHDGLSVSDTSIQDAQGLSRVNVQLLQQRGAMGDPTLP